MLCSYHFAQLKIIFGPRSLILVLESTYLSKHLFQFNNNNTSNNFLECHSSVFIVELEEVFVKSVNTTN